MVLSSVLKTLLYLRGRWRTVVLVITPLLLLPLITTIATPESRCAFVVILMATFWATEPMPLPITALFPVVLLPLLGLASTEDACAPYLKSSNMLFLGCLALALAVEKSNLHQRIALKVLLQVGTQFQWILLGFMLTTMFLSMWIVTTATVAMMLPIADEILANLFPNQSQIEDQKKLINCQIISIDSSHSKISTNLAFSEDHSPKKNKLSKLLYLSIAYSATIGGASTLTANGPNLIMKFILEEIYKNRDPVDYASWFVFAAPFSILITLLLWLSFRVIFVRNISVPKGKESVLKTVIRNKYDKLGPITFYEWSVLAVFLTMIMLYFLHDPHFMTGWSKLLSINNIRPKSATAAIFCTLLLFVIPANPFGAFPSGALLDWKTMQSKLEWGVIILRGGGFSMADAVTSSGLSRLMGQQLAYMDFLPNSLLVILMASSSSLLIEFMRTSATATIVIPVVNQLALDLGINPLILVICVALSCAYAYILPVGTTANTLVYYHADLKISDMLLPGMIAKIISISVMVLNLYLIGFPIFNLSEPTPDWLFDTQTIANDISLLNTTNFQINTNLTQS